MKKQTINIWILIFTILYVIIFGVYYLVTKNYEFIWYVVILLFLIGFMIFLHKKYNFSSWVLIGASIWGLMHMAGGSIYISGVKLYGYILWPLFSSNIAGTDILRYDQLAHFYCYIVVTFIMFYILKSYLVKNPNKFAVSILLIFIAMGIGALNEILEFIPVLFLETTGVGDYFNTLWDIVFNTLGAVFAVLIINLRKKI